VLYDLMSQSRARRRLCLGPQTRDPSFICHQHRPRAGEKR
jgi:hypothetical protein